MMRAMLWIAVLLIGIFFGLNALLSDDGLLRYASLHPNSKIWTMAPLWMGHIYYTAQDYEEAQRYFDFTASHNHHSPVGEEAGFYALVCRRFEGRAHNEDYMAYLQEYSSGTFHDTGGALGVLGIRAEV
jgi:hypothetical protein